MGKEDSKELTNFKKLAEVQDKELDRRIRILEKAYAADIGPVVERSKLLSGEVKSGQAKLLSLSAGITALGKECETLKKDSASMMDISAVKKLVAELTRRVAALESQK